MRAASVAGLVLASLTKLASAQDLLFYENMLYTEYDEATKVLGLTAHVATDAEWRSYTTADFAKYKAIIIPDPNCGTIDRIGFLDDTKAVWSPAVQGKMILIGTDPTYHSTSRVGAINLIDDAIKFAASDPDGGTGLYFSLSCYYDSTNITTVDALSNFGTFYVRGRLACYNDAHLVATAAELTTVNDAKLGNWSCSVHEVFTEYPKNGMTPGSDGFEALAIALNATGDGEETYGDGSSGIPYIIARGATPLGCGNGKYEPGLGEECDSGPANGTPGSPCSEACKCLFGVASPGVCNLSNATSSSSSSTSSSSSIVSSSSTALSTTSANSTLPVSTVLVTSSPASPPYPPSSSEPVSVGPPTSMPPGVVTVTVGVGAPSSAIPANSSVPVTGPSPPITTVTTIAAPSSAPSGLPPAEPSTLVTTLRPPNATSPSTPDVPAPPITIVTTIGGSGSVEPPRVTTIVITPSSPVGTLAPGGPAASASSGSGTAPVVTVVASASSPSGSGASSAPGTREPSSVIISIALGAPGVTASVSPSSVTIIASGSVSPGGPSDPGVSSAEPVNTSLSASGSSLSLPGTSILTATAAPVGASSSSPGSSSSSVVLPPTGTPLGTLYSTMTIVRTVGGSSGIPVSAVTIVSTIVIGGSSVTSSPGLPSTSAGSASSGLPDSSLPTSAATSVLTAHPSGSPGSGTAGLPTDSFPTASGSSASSSGSHPSSLTDSVLPINGSTTVSGAPTGTDSQVPSTTPSPSSTGDLVSDSSPTTLPTSGSGSISILPLSYSGISASSFIPPRNATASSNFATVVVPTTLTTTLLAFSPSPTCDAYVGIEIIYFVDIIEVCPEGSTVTQTLTSCTSTMTRPICATSTPGYPCYPCILGTPSAGDTATVTRSSCTSLTTPTATITCQLCSTCATATYTTSVPGYLPGGGCKDCQPYESGPLTLPPTTTTVVTNTVAATSTVVIPLEGHCPGSGGCPKSSDDAPENTSVVPGTTIVPTAVPGAPPTTAAATEGPAPGTTTTVVVPGDPGIPESATTAGHGGGPPAASTHPAVVVTSGVPYTPPTVPTAGGNARGHVAWELVTGVAGAIVCALLLV